MYIFHNLFLKFCICRLTHKIPSKSELLLDGGDDQDDGTGPVAAVIGYLLTYRWKQVLRGDEKWNDGKMDEMIVERGDNANKYPFRLLGVSRYLLLSE